MIVSSIGNYSSLNYCEALHQTTNPIIKNRDEERIGFEKLASFLFLFQPLDVRLRSGVLVSEGRVEVQYQDFWGTVCDDHWTLKEANVVCRSLGYGSAAMAATNAYFGRGMGRVLYYWLFF